MANWTTLKAAIASIIKTNGNQEITGRLLQNALNNIISSVGENATFAGIATPTTNPGAPDGPVFYLATTPGVYSNFGGIEVIEGEAIIFEWDNSSWSKRVTGFATREKLTQLGSNLKEAIAENKEAIDNLGIYKNNLSHLLINDGKATYVKGNIGEAPNISQPSLSGWGSVRLELKNIRLRLKVRGGENAAGYAILDKDGVLLGIRNITGFFEGIVDIPQNAKEIIINNSFNEVASPIIEVIEPLKKQFIEDFEGQVSHSIITNGELIGDYYINQDGALISSIVWETYKYDLSKVILYNVSSFSNNVQFYQVAFYSSLEDISDNTLLGGYTFLSKDKNAQYIRNIYTPNGAKCVLVSNRKGTSRDFSVKGVIKPIIKDKDIRSLSNYFGRYYILSNGGFTESVSWESWIIDDFSKEIIFNCYSNSSDWYNVAFYNGTPSEQTFISGLNIGNLTYGAITINKETIPSSAKYAVLSSRIASGNDTTAMIKEEVPSSIGFAYIETRRLLAKEYGNKDNVLNVFFSIPNSNDFILIKDEIWFAENKYIGGVASENTTIKRYKRDDEGNFVYHSTVETDFGHWNSVDYNEGNDCLLFTNSGNIESTEGNFFTIIKNPLSLSGAIDKERCGIVYHVSPDMGYKINAVWGDSNLGQNNIIYVLSNNSALLTTILLKKDYSGNFNGEYLIIDSKETGISKGIGGLAYWNNILYIGVGVGYSLGMLDLTDLSYKEITKHYYDTNGDEIIGSTQGICIDSKYLWWFMNVGGKLENYLVQYNR